MRLGLQQQSLSQPQLEVEPQQPETDALATGADETTGAGFAGAASAANHAVVTNKNAAFTSVILRWRLSSAVGRRIRGGERFLPKKRRPAPSSFDSTPTRATSS